MINMEGILAVPTLQKEILTVPTVPTIAPMPPVVPAIPPATLPTSSNLGLVYYDIMVGHIYCFVQAGHSDHYSQLWRSILGRYFSYLLGSCSGLKRRTWVHGLVYRVINLGRCYLVLLSNFFEGWKCLGLSEFGSQDHDCAIVCFVWSSIKEPCMKFH